MVRIIRRYQCDKCRKGFPSYREAENCEIDHIAKGAAAEALADFRAAFSQPKARTEGHHDA